MMVMRTRGSAGMGVPSRGAKAATLPASNTQQNHTHTVEACGICEKDIGDNAIGCDECKLRVHNTYIYSGLTQDMLVAISQYSDWGIKFVCMKCWLVDWSLPVAILPQGRLGHNWSKFWHSCTNNSWESVLWLRQALAGQVKTLTEMKDGQPTQGLPLNPHMQNPSSPPAPPRTSVAAVPPAQVRMPPDAEKLSMRNR